MVLNRFFSSFWPRTCIFRNSFGPFKSDLLTTRSPFSADICPGKKVLKSADFGSKNMKVQTNCWKDTQRVKISWLRNLSKNFSFLVQKWSLLGQNWKISLLAHFLKKSILADFPMLQLRRVLSDWAENCVRASSYPKELPYKFSAQTNNTRRSCNTAKMAIFALKGYSLWFLTIFRATPKKAFLGTLGCSSGSKSIFQLILT